MSTRSCIGARCKDGKTRSVYCHYDGYLGHVGLILFNEYNTQEKIEELLSHGEIDSLASTVARTDFYHRDTGADLAIGVGDTFEDSILRKFVYDYEYLWKDGQWWVRSYGGTWYIFGTWIPREDWISLGAVLGETD